MVSRYPQRYPEPQNDVSHAEAELVKCLCLWRNDGAGCRDRTRDPLITNQVLYQLS